MKANILPPDRLTLSEKCLCVSARIACLVVVLMGFAAFLHHPELVGSIVLVGIGLEIRKRRMKRGPTSGIHGTAHFASNAEIAAAGLTGPTGLIVGALPQQPSALRKKPGFIDMARVPMRNVAALRSLLAGLEGPGIFGRRPASTLIRVPSSDKFAHVACYMPTGVGKTWKVVIPNLRVDRDSCVVYDPSGETVRQTAEHRRKEFGHDIHVLDPLGICGGRYSGRLNVLDMVGPDDPWLFDYSNHLAHALVLDRPEARQEPIWHAGNILATGFALHAIMLTGRASVRSLLSLNELLGGNKLHELAESLMDHPDASLRRRAQQMLNFRGRTLDSLLATMTAEHGWMNSPAFSEVMSESTFSTRDIFRRPTTLYVVVPGNRTLEAAPFLRVVLTAILYAAFEAGPDIRRPPVRLYLDELATLGKLDLLMTMYTQARKYSLRSVTFFQSVGQVSEIVGTPDKVQTFRSQMSGELFKAKDLPSAKEISEWIGNTTVQTVSTSSQQGSNGGWSSSQGAQWSQGRSGGWSESTSQTVSETGVPVIRPEEVLQLREQEAIFCSAGAPPVRLNILGPDDVQRSADPAEFVRQQRYYLRRVRRYTAFLLLGLIVPWTAAGVGMIAERMGQFPQSGLPVQQATVPEWQSTVPAWPTPPRMQRLNQRAFRPRGVQYRDE